MELQPQNILQTKGGSRVGVTSPFGFQLPLIMSTIFRLN